MPLLPVECNGIASAAPYQVLPEWSCWREHKYGDTVKRYLSPTYGQVKQAFVRFNKCPEFALLSRFSGIDPLKVYLKGFGLCQLSFQAIQLLLRHFAAGFVLIAHAAFGVAVAGFAGGGDGLMGSGDFLRYELEQMMVQQ